MHSDVLNNLHIHISKKVSKLHKYEHISLKNNFLISQIIFNEKVIAGIRFIF